MNSSADREQLRVRHEALLSKRDDYHNGSAPRGEILSWVARRLEVSFLKDPAVGFSESDGMRYNGGILEIWRDIVLLYLELDSMSREKTDSYELRIKRLLRTFRYPIPTRIVAGVVGCSSGHARRFYWDDKENLVREKEWSQSQRVQQASPQLVQVIQRTDQGECVRCESDKRLVVHHIRPVSSSGEPVPGNLATLCRRCHADAHGGSVNSGEVVYEYDRFWTWVDHG
ncbi:HNH endonuclease [Halogeometricum luteum]|uniref:HNH endonuclease n=1 Tax=Halogeometricum luteum TaxID=2950537 RepID=UPI003CCE0F47